MNIYVSKGVMEVVDILRQNFFRVDYKPNSSNPESPNGYVVPKDKPWETIAIISSVIRWRQVMPHSDYPENANACIQISTEKNVYKKELIKTIKNNLLIIKED